MPLIVSRGRRETPAFARDYGLGSLHSLSAFNRLVDSWYLLSLQLLAFGSDYRSYLALLIEPPMSSQVNPSVSAAEWIAHVYVWSTDHARFHWKCSLYLPNELHARCNPP